MRVIVPAGGGREELVIETPALENLNYFLFNDLTAADASSATVAQSVVKAHTRRSYPGDSTPVNVSGSTREYLKDPGRKSGNGLGGFSFTLVADAGLPGEERRTFTLVRGRMMDLHSFLASDLAMQVYLYGKSGARYVIPATNPTP